MSLTATEGPPELDNLYLDMNGIIHNCTHGNDPNMKLTEDEMILRIFAYLDKLIQLVRPKKLVFMAIDGEPAPAAGAGHRPRRPLPVWPARSPPQCRSLPGRRAAAAAAGRRRGRPATPRPRRRAAHAAPPPGPAST
jgi:hypothetical protein